MALEDIFRALEEQAQRECDEILQDARDQAESISAEAADQAEAIRAARTEEAERVTRQRAAQSANSAKLEAKKRVAGVKEAAVSAAFESAGGSLGKVRGSSGYPAVFKALAEEALAGMEGELEVWVDPADAALAEATLRELGVSAAVRPELETSGGLMVTKDSGRIMRRNTFENRLEKVRLLAQADVAEILFS